MTNHQPYLKIPSWSEDDKPREKLLQKGTSALSDAELIGILLGSGTQSVTAVDLAKHILKSVNYNLHDLAKLSIGDLKKFKGIGEAKAISIVSALELGRRRKDQESPNKIKITTSQDAYIAMIPNLLDLNTEEFWVIHLSRANHILKKERISAGGVSGTVVDPKVIFKSAIQLLSSAMVLVHNHPSGNAEPSSDDILVTKKLVDSGKLLDIKVVDHIIFTNENYYSFADDGLI